MGRLPACLPAAVPFTLPPPHAPHLQQVRLELVHFAEVHAAAVERREDAERGVLVAGRHHHEVAVAQAAAAREEGREAGMV